MINKNVLPNQRPNEHVIAHLWPHPFIFFRIFGIYFLLLLIPVAVYFLLVNLPLNIFSNNLLVPLLTLIGFAYYLVILAMVLFVWMDNYLDVWTITNTRIISRQQNGMFNRVVSELELYRVQDVTVEQKGLLPTILNYGDLYIQTAGKEERFVFKNIGEPVQIARLVQRLDEDAKKNYFNPPV